MRFLKLKEVMELTALSRSSIYLFIEKGQFPASISLGGRAIAWIDKDIESWMKDKVRDNEYLNSDEIEVEQPTAKMRFIKLTEVKERTALSRSSIYKHMALDTFPKTISLGDRAVAWLESDIEEWMEGRLIALDEVA